MDTTSPTPETSRLTGRCPLSLRAAMLLAISLGLAGGYLDLVILVFKKYYWNDMRNIGSGSDFPWSVPVVHSFLLVIVAALLAAVSRLRSRPITLSAGAWILATLAIWGALLRMPLYGVSSLLLAAGIGRTIGGAVATGIIQHSRRARLTLAGLVGVLIVLAVLSSSWKAIREHRAVAGLPTPPPGARNVVLIVWDTVRAYNLSLHDYPRETTPNLVRWAGKASSSVWPWRRPRGRIPLIAASSRATGRSR